METRKVQMTGGSSLMITLPKEWTGSAGIKKNDTLNLQPLDDGSLLITPLSNESTAHRMKTIDVDDISDMDLLFRMLVGGYMSGYDVMEIRSAERISDNVRDAVERMTQTAIGVEIIEEYDDRMVLKDLVDPSEMRMDRTVERMRSLTSNMMKDIFRSMAEHNTDAMDAIIARDKDLDRLEWLVTRQTNMGHSDSSICRRMDLTQQSMMRSYTLCRIIERIGDHAVAIARNVHAVMEKNVKMTEEIVTIGRRANSLFDDVIHAWRSDDMYEANGCIKECMQTVGLCSHINRYAMDEDFDTAMSATLIAGSIRRILEYSIDIAELVIDGSM